LNTSGVVSCIGSADPLIREYVHDFGLCTMNIVWLECGLREHLRRLAFLRATWPLRVRNFRKKHERFEEMTLGTLTTEFERVGENPNLVVGLRRIVDGRKYLLHQRISLYDPEVGEIPRRRIHELRKLIHELYNDARERDHAVEKADQSVFEAIMKRVRAEQPSDSATMAETDRIIAANGRRTNNYPSA